MMKTIQLLLGISAPGWHGWICGLGSRQRVGRGSDRSNKRSPSAWLSLLGWCRRRGISLSRQSLDEVYKAILVQNLDAFLLSLLKLRACSRTSDEIVGLAAHCLRGPPENSNPKTSKTGISVLQQQRINARKSQLHTLPSISKNKVFGRVPRDSRHIASEHKSQTLEETQKKKNRKKEEEKKRIQGIAQIGENGS
jgi:hypothetical protein